MTLKVVGAGLVFVGVVWGLVALNMETTVEAGGQTIGSGLFSIQVPKTRVNNLGLMEERRNHLIIAGVAVLSGVILFGFGTMSTPTRQIETSPCPHCAEFIRREAKICRFCQRTVSTTSVMADAAQTAQGEPTTSVVDLSADPPASTVRPCPWCSKPINAAATRCGYCWKTLATTA